MKLQLFARLVGPLALLFCAGVVAAQAVPPGTAKGPPLTAQQQEYLKERAQALKRVNLLFQAGKKAEAVALWEKELACTRRVFGPFHEEVDKSAWVLARLHELREDFPAAETARQEVLAIRLKLYGAKHWRVTDARLDLEHLKRLAQLKAVDRRRLEQATALTQQAKHLWQAGQSRKALPLAHQALAIRKELLGEAHPHYALTLHSLALLYGDLGEYGKALTLFEQASDLTKRLGEGHPHYATSLNSLAGLYMDLGEYGKALTLSEQAHDLTKRVLGEAHPHYAERLISLAGLYQKRGEYGKALPLLEQARDLRKRVLGEDDPEYAASLNNLAVLYQDLGEYGKALPLYQHARDLTKRLGEAHPDYAASLNNLANLYRDLGEYGKAVTLLEQARDLRKRHRGGAHPDYAASLSNLALLYRDLGEYGKALSLLEQARDITKRLPRTHPGYVTNLNNLANLYGAMEAYGKAVPLSEQARDLSKRLLGEAHPHYAACLSNLARLYRDLQEYGKALPLLEEFRDLTKRVLGEAHPHYATSLHNLALLYRDLGEYGKALTLSEQAHDLTKRVLGEAHPHYAERLMSLAGLYRAVSKTAEATKFAQQALTLQQALLNKTFTFQSNRARFNLLAQHRYSLDVYLSFALDAGTHPVPLYRVALVWKGTLAARQAEELLTHDRPELRPLADQLRRARAGLARLASQLPATPQAQADWRSLFARFEKEKEALEIQLARRSAAYLRWQKLRQADAAQVADALPRGAAFIDFLEYRHWSPPPTKKGRWDVEARLLAFVLRRQRAPVLVPLGPAQEIDRAVHAWRQAVQAHRDPGPAAAELAKRLWQPLRPHLAGCDTVLLAPDGVLTGLAFAALPGPKAGTYLLEEVALGYVSSGRHLLELAAADDGPRGQGLLAVGGLVYGQAKADGPAAAKRTFGDLPGTRLEVEQVGRLFRQQFPTMAAPRLLGGAEIDADALTALLAPAKGAARPRYLHLATHGFFEPTPPAVQKLRHALMERLPFEAARQYGAYGRNPLLLSGLVLAGANRDREKGILRAEELANLDLRGCELAVLSACETGLGRVDPGEGLQGLQWAFQAAGARSLVVSLWQVHDAATSVLMEELYTNLWQKKLSRLEALRQAQLTVLRNPSLVQQRQQELAKLGVRGPEDEPAPLPQGGAPAASARSHPALWAAFILSGDTGPVVGGDRKAGQPE
jgi:CHAT domain-containing protein